MSEEEKKYNQIMSKNEITKEEAEDIIDEMYQFKNRILGENNTIYVDRIVTVQFTNLECASVRMLREVRCLESKVKKLEKELDKKDKLYNKALTDLVKAEKVIDLMVKELAIPGISIERMNLYNNVSPDKPIWNLIKEYFYKKVEEENE